MLQVTAIFGTSMQVIILKYGENWQRAASFTTELKPLT